MHRRVVRHRSYPASLAPKPDRRKNFPASEVCDRGVRGTRGSMSLILLLLLVFAVMAVLGALARPTIYRRRPRRTVVEETTYLDEV